MPPNFAKNTGSVDSVDAPQQPAYVAPAYVPSGAGLQEQDWKSFVTAKEGTFYIFKYLSLHKFANLFFILFFNLLIFFLFFFLRGSQYLPLMGRNAFQEGDQDGNSQEEGATAWSITADSLQSGIIFF